MCLEVIDPAVVPEEEAKPKRALICVLVTLAWWIFCGDFCFDSAFQSRKRRSNLDRHSKICIPTRFYYGFKQQSPQRNISYTFILLIGPGVIRPLFIDLKHEKTCFLELPSR